MPLLTFALLGPPAALISQRLSDQAPEMDILFYHCAEPLRPLGMGRAPTRLDDMRPEATCFGAIVLTGGSITADGAFGPKGEELKGLE